MATISEAAKLIGVDREKVKSWATEFAEFLSPAANPPSGRERRFGEADLRVLAVIAELAEMGEDAEDIQYALNTGRQDEERLVEWACLHTPLFQEPPDELDETWRHGVLLGGMAERRWADVAHSYKLAADELVEKALKSGEPHELDYPILFLYRHSIEVYLKAMLKDPPGHHDIERLTELLEKQHAGKIQGWVRDRLRDFHRIDGISDVFRYAGGPAEGELWLDLHHLKVVMGRLCTAFEPYLLYSRG